MLWNKIYPQTLTNPRNHNHKTKQNHKTHTTTLRQRNGERKKKKKTMEMFNCLMKMEKLCA